MAGVRLYRNVRFGDGVTHRRSKRIGIRPAHASFCVPLVSAHGGEYGREDDVA